MSYGYYWLPLQTLAVFLVPTKGTLLSPSDMEVPVSVESIASQDVAACAVIRGTFDRLGDKWSLLVIKLLSDGPLRFSVLKEATGGISQRMLTLTLRKLERDGLITRTAFPEVPPRVEYALSPLGRTLVEPVTALAEWAVVRYAEISENQQSFDRNARSATKAK